MVSLDKRDTEGHEQRGSTLGTRGQSATGPAEGPRADSGGTNSADICALDLWPLNQEDGSRWDSSLNFGEAAGFSGGGRKAGASLSPVPMTAIQPHSGAAPLSALLPLGKHPQ